VDLQEKLYKKFIGWRSKRRLEQDASIAVQLSELKPRLSLIARALTGAPIEITGAIREGGWKGNRFYLPERMSLFADLKLNFNYYLFRVFFLSKQRELRLNWFDKSDHSIHESRSIADRKAPLIIQELQAEFSQFEMLHSSLVDQLEDSSWLYGKYMSDDLLWTPEHLENISKHAQANQNNEITTEIDSKPVEEMISIQVDKKAQEDFTLQHNFEKIETAEEFDDIWRDFDGDDTLEDDMQALDDLNLKHTVRVDDVVHSVYKADFGGQLTVAESKALKEDGFHYTYPEWNTNNRSYRESFCKVFPLLYKSVKSTYANECIRKNQRSIRTLKKNLAQFFNATSQVKRVLQGDEFDLDEVTDMYTDIHAKVTPHERIYISKRKKKKDLSMLFLIDLSLSGDSYVAGQKVIDIEKQAVLILGEVFSEFDIEFQVDGFFSKTRNFCSYVTLKHFRDRWQTGKVNIGAIAPQGFTRIGPAIRHAGYLLSKRESKRKWVILLSDGKPNDYDRYEGNYGLEDIKHALKELRQNQVESYAIAIEESAKYYLPQMFGVNHYSIMSDPDKLPESVMKLYSKIALSR